MKSIQSFLVVILLAISGTTLAEITIVNLSDGSTVHEHGFKIVAKTDGYITDSILNVIVSIQNMDTGLEGHVDAFKGPNQGPCMIYPPQDDITVSLISLGFCHGISHPFPIVAKVHRGGFVSGDMLQVSIYIYDGSSINDFSEAYVLVR